MQAIILAGGIGSRLKPLTENLPKPMIPLLNKPLMEYTVELLKRHNLTNIGVTVMFLPQKIKEHFADGNAWRIDMSYFQESTPLGTAGSVKMAENQLEETFLVISGDALTNVDLTKILEFHNSKEADVTIVLSKQENPLEYGVVLTDKEGRVTSFLEKPQWENVVSNTVNTGIYVINKSVLSKVPKNQFFDFSRDLFPLLMQENAKIFGFITEDYWCDLGTPKAYLQAHSDLLAGKVFGKKYENVLEENVVLSAETKLIPPVYIGKNTILSGSNVIGPNAVIGNDSILDNVKIKNSVLWNKNILSYSDLTDSAVGENSKIYKAHLEGGNIIGSNAKLKENSHLSFGTSVSDNCVCYENSSYSGTVDSSRQKNIPDFENGIIKGVWNHSLLPTHLCGIASSYGENKILVAVNSTRLAENLGFLLATNFTLCGINVYLTACAEPSCRFFCATNSIKAVYIFEEHETVYIQLIDEKGLNISSSDEKKIDFNKCAFSLIRGKIIKIKSIDKDFEYFCNASIPFSRENVEIQSSQRLKLHNVIWKNQYSAVSNTNIASLSVSNGQISAATIKSVSLSGEEIMKLKIDVAAFLGGTEIFLPVYAPESVVEFAKSKSLKILWLYQHKGNAMQQADGFNSISILLEFVPEFFAQALSFFLSRESFSEHADFRIVRFDFDSLPQNACNTIFALNKNGDSSAISARYKNAFITVVPKNNGYSFTAYGRFAKDEFAPELVPEFIKNTLSEI
ncbi:MAG: NTP transferase domain-containing protein [Clostridia bacterium]|nr:NTP transferase domain-containing protein [Clostridia bacterium]